MAICPPKKKVSCITDYKPSNPSCHCRLGLRPCLSHGLQPGSERPSANQLPPTAVQLVAEDGRSLDLKTAPQAVDAMPFASVRTTLRLQDFDFGLVVLGAFCETSAHWQVPWPSRRGRHLPHEGYLPL